jgi:hypothetical protein
VREGHEVDRHGFRDSNEVDGGLGDVGGHPDRAQVGDRHEGGGGVRMERNRGSIFSGRDVDLEHVPCDRRPDDDGLVELVRLEIEQLELPPGLFPCRLRNLIA